MECGNAHDGTKRGQRPKAVIEMKEEKGKKTTNKDKMYSCLTFDKNLKGGGELELESRMCRIPAFLHAGSRSMDLELRGARGLVVRVLIILGGAVLFLVIFRLDLRLGLPPAVLIAFRARSSGRGGAGHGARQQQEPLHHEG